MRPGFIDDPHSERGNWCPRNIFGITDYAELQLREGPAAARRGLELEYRGMQGKFDIPHLQSVHRYLFQDVFPWAGEFRVVNISKGNTNFGPAMHIANALKELFDKLAKEEVLVGLDASTFVARAAYYLGEINAIHPFREGNGRYNGSSSGSSPFMLVIRSHGRWRGRTLRSNR